MFFTLRSFYLGWRGGLFPHCRLIYSEFRVNFMWPDTHEKRDKLTVKNKNNTHKLKSKQMFSTISSSNLKLKKITQHLFAPPKKPILISDMSDYVSRSRLTFFKYKYIKWNFCFFYRRYLGTHKYPPYTAEYIKLCNFRLKVN